VSGRAGWADRALLLATLVADKSPLLIKGSLAPAKQPALKGAPRGRGGGFDCRRRRAPED